MPSSAPAPLLVLASRNAKKLVEIRELLAPLGIELRLVSEYPHVPDVVEDQATFAGNAAKKARETALATGCWALGEDSGLEVQALGGAPGVYSARYSGPGATDASNNAKLQVELAAIPDAQRAAAYVCHAALADPQGRIRLTSEARCRGRIVRSARGENGFGYDPYFLIPEYHQTFGELSSLVKQQLSHRGRALRLLAPRLSALFWGESTSPGAAAE